MILSDRSIREELAAGRIVIDPLHPEDIQPSSVDLHVDRYFRVFRNDTTPFIDPRQAQEDLTELVTVDDGRAFILHPGEFVLGSTSESVALPDDLVARLEGKSSLGRLGLLIHSSLPASERVMILEGGHLGLRPISEVVTKRIPGSVVSFDPETLEAGYHPITGWYEGPPDRIYEVLLASGRKLRVTAGHNLFTLDRHGNVVKTRTAQLRAGVHVAIARRIPDPPPVQPALDLLSLAPERTFGELVIAGPSVADAFARDAEIPGLFHLAGFRHVGVYRDRARMPLPVALQVPELLGRLGPEDRLSVRGSARELPLRVEVDAELAWYLGLYTAEGSRRRNSVVVSNTKRTILDRAQSLLASLGIPASREGGRVTACSTLFSHVIDWLEPGHSARTKQLPSPVLGWPSSLLESFLEGFVDGDGSRQPTRTVLWSSSDRLVDDLLYLCARLGRRASASLRNTTSRYLYQVSLPSREHKLLTAVPLPDRLLVELREGSGLDQLRASQALGYRHATDLNNIERRCQGDAVRFRTLRRFRDFYRSITPQPVALRLLDRLVDGDVAWDRVVEVRDSGIAEPIYDLEIRPGGRRIENFIAGAGGVFVSNTAGFVDAGFEGHLTLELSNVANLPIAIYPGMKIGQISFLRMTTPADVPYGGAAVGSKYQGQRGPTPSRYYENFR